MKGKGGKRMESDVRVKTDTRVVNGWRERKGGQRNKLEQEKIYIYEQ